MPGCWEAGKVICRIGCDASLEAGVVTDVLDRSVQILRNSSAFREMMDWVVVSKDGDTMRNWKGLYDAFSGFSFEPKSLRLVDV
jgi:hypothetical protein